MVEHRTTDSLLPPAGRVCQTLPMASSPPIRSTLARSAWTVASACLCLSCSFVKLTAGGVGAKVAPSKASQNWGSPQRSKLIHGFVERLASDLRSNGLVVATTLDGELAARVAIGRQGYYNLFLPPGTYRLSGYLDRDENGTVEPSELAGQIKEAFTVPESQEVAYFDLDLRLNRSSNDDISDLAQVLETAIPLDFGQPELAATKSFDADVYGSENVKLGSYESTVSFFSHVSPLHHLEELDLTTGRIPMVLVHGINDSPQIFRHLHERIPREVFEPMYFYYPTGARLPAMAKLLHRLFFSGTMLPTFEHSVLLAHSMGGLVARGSLNQLEGVSGESRVDVYGSYVSPYGGVSAAEFGIKTGPVIVPSWIDVSPNGDYLVHLFKPLPTETRFFMMNGNRNKTSDGVIRLESQRRPEALEQASKARIFPDTHVGILADEHALDLMLSWAQEALGTSAESARSQESRLTAAPIVPRHAVAEVSDEEKSRRGYALHVALHQVFLNRAERIYVSLIGATIARLRIEDGKHATVLQVTVGDNVRVDQPQHSAPLLLRPWPQDVSKMAGLAADIAQIAEEELASSNLVAGPPPVPAALQGDSTPGHDPTNDARTPPPPIALSSGFVGSTGISGDGMRLMIPLKFDAYFGYIGSGLEVRKVAQAGWSEYSQASLLYEPWTISGTLRVRFGSGGSLTTASLGVGGGVEFGLAELYPTGTRRVRRSEDNRLDRDYLAIGFAHLQGSLGLRIHQDFYAFCMGELGMRFTNHEFRWGDDATLQLSSHAFASGILGVEVRLP